MAYWNPKIATGLWCVGGQGATSWQMPLYHSAIVVPKRMGIIKKAGLDGYSGHVGGDYEFDLSHKRATNHFGKVKEAGDKAGLICVDIVGSRFKAPDDRYGTFTSGDPKVRQVALDNMYKAGDLAQKWDVKTIRVWFGSDGKKGPFHTNSYETLPRIRDGLLAFHDRYNDLRVAIEGKPGEPTDLQAINGTGNGIALCMALNYQSGVPFKDGRFQNAWARIGPETNHQIMNGEDMEEGVAQAIDLGVMGDLHACDGLFRVARDFDEQFGKYNPTMLVELLDRMQQGYEQGKYDSNWIILDQNANLAPRGRQQIGHLALSKHFIRAALDVTSQDGFRLEVNRLREKHRFSDLDAFVMGEVGSVMQKSAELYREDMGTQ